MYITLNYKGAIPIYLFMMGEYINKQAFIVILSFPIEFLFVKFVVCFQRLRFIIINTFSVTQIFVAYGFVFYIFHNICFFHFNNFIYTKVAC